MPISGTVLELCIFTRHSVPNIPWLRPLVLSIEGSYTHSIAVLLFWFWLICCALSFLYCGKKSCCGSGFQSSRDNSDAKMNSRWPTRLDTAYLPFLHEVGLGILRTVAPYLFREMRGRAGVCSGLLATVLALHVLKNKVCLMTFSRLVFPVHNHNVAYGTARWKFGHSQPLLCFVCWFVAGVSWGFHHTGAMAA